MKHTVRFLATLIAAVLPSAAQDNRSLIDELLSVYQERSRAEVRTLAEQLDQNNEAVIRQMPKGAFQPVRSAVDLAWQSAPQSLDVFRQLVDSPRKFTRWSAKEGLPSWFSVADSVSQVSRWEALRPILAPFATGDRLGWDLPDVRPWSDQPGAWRFELESLLRWPDAPGAVTEELRETGAQWAVVQVGRNFLSGWRTMPGDTYRMLHGQYEYAVLPRPPAKADLPPRLRAMLTHFNWTGKGELMAFLREKEALSADLLTQILGAGTSQPITFEWFDATARSFPPVSAFGPEWNADKQRVEAKLERQDSDQIRNPMREAVVRLNQAGAAVPAFKSILWYPSAMTTDGRLQLPVAGWSSWVPEVDAAGTAPPDADKARIPAAPPETLWHGLCVWVEETLFDDIGSTPIRFDIANSTGWALAFRREELEQVAGPNGDNRLAFGSTKGGKPIRTTLSIVAVDPDRSITAELRIGSRLVGTRTYAVPGPWPPWVASRRWPAWKGIASIETWVAFALLLFWGYWTWRMWSTDDRQLPWVATGSAGLLGLGMAVLILWGQVPSQSRELGGIVEFSLPLNGASPPALRKIVSSVAGSVYEQLGQSVQKDPKQVLNVGFRDRWWYALRRISWLSVDSRVAVQADAVTRLKYRIVPAALGGDVPVAGGLIERGGTQEFRKVLKGLESTGYDREPDLPSVLVHGAGAGVRLAVVLSDGDHGAVRTPASPEMADPKSNILTVELMSPTRDGRETNGLQMKSRQDWIERRSGKSVALQLGSLVSLQAALPSPPSPPDEFGRHPLDLEQERIAWWQKECVSDAAVAAASRDVANKVSDWLKDSKSVMWAGSHTILRAHMPLLARMCMWPALLALACAYHLRTDAARWQDMSVWRKLTIESFLVPSAASLFALPLIAARLSSIGWAFGENLLDSVADVRSWLLLLFLTAIAVRMGVLYLSKSESDESYQTHYKFSLPRWAALACGTIAIALALTCWIAAPVPYQGSGSWLPANYPADAMAGLAFWLAGVILLTKRFD